METDCFKDIYVAYIFVVTGEKCTYFELTTTCVFILTVLTMRLFSSGVFL